MLNFLSRGPWREEGASGNFQGCPGIGEEAEGLQGGRSAGATGPEPGDIPPCWKPDPLCSPTRPPCVLKPPACARGACLCTRRLGAACPPAFQKAAFRLPSSPRPAPAGSTQTSLLLVGGTTAFPVRSGTLASPSVGPSLGPG